MGKSIGKDITKSLTGKYGQKLRDHPKQSDTYAPKSTSKRAIQATGDLIRNKIADKITRASKTLSQNNSTTNEEEIPKERYIYIYIYIYIHTYIYI